MSTLLETLPLLALMMQGPVYFSYIDRLKEWWPPSTIAQGIGVPGYAQHTAYNVLSLGFINSEGSRDIAKLWQIPVFYFGSESGFGTSNEKIQKNLIQRYHTEGILVMASAFGDTEKPTSKGLDATQTCTELAEFVRDNNLDGLDIDWIDNEAMENGTGEKWLIECTLAVRSVLHIEKYYVSHSPQAPYFDYNFYKNGGYARVNYEVGYLINWYNVQYFNQGETKYDTYEALFHNSTTGAFSNTSVKKIHESAWVPLHKIVICKPVKSTDAENTGWVSAAELGEWAERAKKEFHWQAGLSTWEFDSDSSGNFVKDFQSNLS